MKIKINENETYDIIIPEQVQQDEFQGLLNRLQQISKLLGKDVFIMQQPTPKLTRAKSGKNKPSLPTFVKDKATALEIMKEIKNKKWDLLAERYKEIGRPLSDLSEIKYHGYKDQSYFQRKFGITKQKDGCWNKESSEPEEYSQKLG